VTTLQQVDLSYRTNDTDDHVTGRPGCFERHTRPGALRCGLGHRRAVKRRTVFKTRTDVTT